MSKGCAEALVLLSGGQDSTTCLFWALREVERGNFSGVRALAVRYGQRHAVELEAARKVADLAGVELEVLDVGPILKSTSPLVGGSQLGKYESVAELPGGIEPTFVPARNILFLTLAVNRAAITGSADIVTGLCEEDFGGYPDCRREFVDSMEQTAGLGLSGDAGQFRIHTPLMRLNKAASVHLAAELGGRCMEALAWSHTCYDGAVPPCGKCHACHLRARGFGQAGIPDPLVERVGGGV